MTITVTLEDHTVVTSEMISLNVMKKGKKMKAKKRPMAPSRKKSSTVSMMGFHHNPPLPRQSDQDDKSLDRLKPPNAVLLKSSTQKISSTYK